MIIPDFIVASTNFTSAPTLSSGLNQFLAARSPAWDMMSTCWHDGILSCPQRFWTSSMEWLAQPHVVAVIFAWWIAFTAIATLILSLGFGPGGIAAGSLAAAFQSWAYGGFTPAGGIFATLTSVAMFGAAFGPAVILVAGLATGVAVVVRKCGVGR